MQLAWPYQLVKVAPSLAIWSTFGVGWPSAGAAARIGAEIVPAGVVGHQHDDVGPLLLRRGRRTPATVAASAIGIAAATRCFDATFIGDLPVSLAQLWAWEHDSFARCRRGQRPACLACWANCPAHALKALSTSSRSAP